MPPTLSSAIELFFSRSTGPGMSVRHLLVPTDFSPHAGAALRHALALAEAFNATVRLLHVVNDPRAGGYGLGDAYVQVDQWRSAAEAEARARLEELADASDGPTVRTDVVERAQLDVADAIAEYTERFPIDLVVMGTHGREGVGRLVLGSVANALIRRSACPVMTVRDRDEDENQTAAPGAYETLLAPIDFSEHSRRALHLAKEIAHPYGATRHLLFVAEKRVLPTFSDTGLPGVGVVEMDPEIVENAAEALEAFDNHVDGPAGPCACHVVEGDVAATIVEFAEANRADLIVMATRGLTGIDRFVLGSNTERVVRRAPCPVLTVPPRDA